eukprot:scaffold12852_cov19-Tisochrysis_lutea.AAC.1
MCGAKHWGRTVLKVAAAAQHVIFSVDSSVKPSQLFAPALSRVVVLCRHACACVKNKLNAIACFFGAGAHQASLFTQRWKALTSQVVADLLTSSGRMESSHSTESLYHTPITSANPVQT